MESGIKQPKGEINARLRFNSWSVMRIFLAKSYKDQTKSWSADSPVRLADMTENPEYCKKEHLRQKCIQRSKYESVEARTWCSTCWGKQLESAETTEPQDMAKPELIDLLLSDGSHPYFSHETLSPLLHCPRTACRAYLRLNHTFLLGCN